MRFVAVEGNTQKLDGGALFGNAPKELWKQWLKPDERNRLHMAARSLLVETDDGRRVLFDVGIGVFFDPKLKDRFGVMESEPLLIQNLEAMGIGEEEIDIVVLTHLHFDHAGGLLTPFGEERRLHFPKATYYTGRMQWERACHPQLRDRASYIPEIQQLLQSSGRLVLIDEEGHPDLDFVRFSLVHGHTPGLLLPRFELSSGPLVVSSDLVPGIPWIHLPIAMGYDRFPEKTIEEKKVLLEDLVPKEGKLFFTHDPFTPCVQVQQDQKGRFTGQPFDLSAMN